MESDIYSNTALPLASDLQSFQTPHISIKALSKQQRELLRILWYCGKHGTGFYPSHKKPLKTDYFMNLIQLKIQQK